MPQARRLVCFFVLFVLVLSLIGAADDLPRVTLSLPPVMGSLPLAFARGWNLFEEGGLDVELIGLSDNQARILALMAGNIDGMICDVTTAILLVTSGTDIVITSTAYQPEQTGSLTLLCPSYFNIDSLDDLLSRTENGNSLKSIAITEMSDIEYSIDTLLKSHGYTLDPDKDYSYWYDMLQIATFLALGSVYAAVLPEPYTTYISNYPQINPNSTYLHLSDFNDMDILPSVLVFRREVVEESPEVIDLFYDIYRQAIDMINALSRDELIEMGIDEALSLFFPGLTEENVPEGIMDSFVIPHFPQLKMLAEEQFEAVVAWVNDKCYTWKQPPYEEMTTNRFLK
jgi:NitT/TauT family transport system substrate-binding protein